MSEEWKSSEEHKTKTRRTSQYFKLEQIFKTLQIFDFENNKKHEITIPKKIMLTSKSKRKS